MVHVSAAGSALIAALKRGPGGLQAGVQVAVLADLIGGHPPHSLGLPRGRGRDVHGGQLAAGELETDHERPVGPAALVRAGRLQLGGQRAAGHVDPADFLARLAHRGLPRRLTDVDRAAERRPGAARRDLSGAVAQQHPGPPVRGHGPGQDPGGATRTPVTADVAIAETLVNRAVFIHRLTHGLTHGRSLFRLAPITPVEPVPWEDTVPKTQCLGRHSDLGRHSAGGGI